MSPFFRFAQAAICLPILGLLFFLPPYITIFDQGFWVAGLPGLPVMIFSVWFIGIGLTFWVSHQLNKHDPRLDQDPVSSQGDEMEV